MNAMREMERRGASAPGVGYQKFSPGSTRGAAGGPGRVPRRSLAPLALLLVACLALTGCGGGETEPAGSQSAADAPPSEPVAGGTLVVAVQDGAKSLDPHVVTDAASMRMIENLYSTLLRHGEGFDDLRPDLAESVEVSDDGLTVTITLREGATFHSGRPVTAADVAYSIERIRERGVRSQHFAAVEAIETPDERTAVLRLTEPVAPLRTYLAYPMNAIVDREVVEANGGRLDQAEAGSGPFRLVEWNPGRELVMERFAGYHVEGRPYLDRVVIRPMSDETARTTSLRTGEIDLITDVPAKDTLQLDGASGVRMESVPGTFWEYLGLNTQRPPLDDPRVRQAIAWAIDREALNQLVKLGRATPLAGGPIPPNHWAHADLNVYPRRDPEKARELLAAAGHPDGFGLLLKVPTAFPYQVQAGEVIKQQLADVGIDVELRGLESSVFFDQLNAGDFDATIVGWVGQVDPDEYLYEIFHSQGKYNQQGYANPEVDRLLEEGRATLDRAERAAIYAEAQRIIAEEAPMAFLYVNDHTSAWRDRVHGFEVHPTASTISLRETWKER